MNNQDDKNMVKTKIEGTDFIYNSEINYEKEGHIYCKRCNERVIACSIANAIINKYSYSVKMRNLSQILNDLQKGGFNLDRNEYIENITSPTLLILDDFGIERNTEYALEQIYNIINARYLKSKPTIITTNLNFKDIETEQEDIMLGRIYSRIIEMCLPLRVIGADRRKIQSKEKMKKAQNLIDE